MHNFPLPCLVFCIWLPYTVSLWTSCYLILFPVFISLYADFPIFLSTVFLSPDSVTRLSLSIYDYLLSFCYFSLSWWFFPYLSLSLFKFPSLFYIISLTWFYITCLSHYMRLSTSYTLVSLYYLLLFSLSMQNFDTYWASENNSGCSIDVLLCHFLSPFHHGAPT